MPLSDETIKTLSTNANGKNMIENFVDHQVKILNGNPAISYGLSSYGYDVRLSNKFTIYKSKKDNFSEDTLKNLGSSPAEKNYVIDPKKPNNTLIQKFESDVPFEIEPHGFLLGLTLEKFNIPKDIMVVCIGKSTYARCGLYINVTPIEPGCSGHVVLEIANTTNNPVMVYPNEGICQFIFLRGDKPCSISYEEKKGKYMSQEDIVMPHA